MDNNASDKVKLIYQSAKGEYIKDWSSLPEGVKLPLATYADYSMHNTAPYYMGLYKTDSNEYHTSGIVGVGWLKDYRGSIVFDEKTGQECAIMIRPRFESMNPWNMLAKVLADPEYDDYVKQNGEFYTFDTNQKLIPVPSAESGGQMLAALSFLKLCEKICRRNLSRTMSFVEENLNGRVVGNILVSKQIKYNVVNGREDRIYCRYPVFTIDTLENRILKAALNKAHLIIKNASKSVELQKMYAYCMSSLKMVSTVQIVRSDFNRIRTTGFYSNYKTIMNLAQIILFSEGIADLHNSETDDTRLVIPYTINMEKLFEFYVRSIVKDYIKANPQTGYKLDDYRNNGINPLNVLKDDAGGRNSAYIMNNYIPDVAIYVGSETEKKYVGVFDVKYQHSTNRANATAVRHNSHQLLFYLLLLNANTCGFIFPKEKNAKEISDGMQLLVQNGNRIADVEDAPAYYTQWLIDFEQENDKSHGFADRMIEYFNKIKPIE